MHRKNYISVLIYSFLDRRLSLLIARITLWDYSPSIILYICIYKYCIYVFVSHNSICGLLKYVNIHRKPRVFLSSAVALPGKFLRGTACGLLDTFGSDSFSYIWPGYLERTSADKNGPTVRQEATVLCTPPTSVHITHDHYYWDSSLTARMCSVWAEPCHCSWKSTATALLILAFLERYKWVGQLWCFSRIIMGRFWFTWRPHAPILQLVSKKKTCPETFRSQPLAPDIRNCPLDL